jgi:hypothetical protein
MTFGNRSGAGRRGCEGCPLRAGCRLGSRHARPRRGQARSPHSSRRRSAGFSSGCDVVREDEDDAVIGQPARRRIRTAPGHRPVAAPPDDPATIAPTSRRDSGGAARRQWRQATQLFGALLKVEDLLHLVEPARFTPARAARQRKLPPSTCQMRSARNGSMCVRVVERGAHRCAADRRR